MNFSSVRRVNRVTPLLIVVAVCFGMSLATAGVAAQDQRQTQANQDQDEAPAALSFTMQTLGGETKKLSDYEGKVVLVVNTASKCGLTPQYAGLQGLYEKYKDKGLVVLGFPCNQFGGQEPGTATEISTFCTENYGVTFPMFAKINVNGESACELYKHLTALETMPAGSGDISWNFEKFLIDRSGKVVARFSPRTKPEAEDFVQAIEKQLGE